VNQLRSANFDVLKRPRVLIALGVIVVLAAVFYFAWWSPEGNKISATDATKQAQASQITSLRNQLALVTAEGKFVQRYETFLTFFGNEVPVQPEQGVLVDMLGRLAISDRVTITTLSDNTLNAVKPPAFSTIPVSMTVTGPYSNVLKFLSDLYGLPRLLTIQEVQPTPSGARGTVNILAPGSLTYTMTISGTAYYSGVAAIPPGGSSSS
jgi:Tfp pilus assembly protein PilO